MSLHRLLAVLTLAFAVIPTAHAEDATSTPIHYQFDDDLVDGALKSSPNEVLFVRTRMQRESLVRAREHWIPELYRTMQTWTVS